MPLVVRWWFLLETENRISFSLMEESNVDTEWRALGGQVTNKPVPSGSWLARSPSVWPVIGPALDTNIPTSQLNSYTKLLLQFTYENRPSSADDKNLKILRPNDFQGKKNYSLWRRRSSAHCEKLLRPCGFKEPIISYCKNFNCGLTDFFA